MGEQNVIPDRSTDVPEATRRNLLNLFLGTGAIAWIGTILFPVLKYLSPLKESGGANEVVLGDKDRENVEAQGFSIVAIGTDRVIVFQDPTGRIRACSAKCTHEGCTVQYKKDESLIWCACHNGRFDIDGRVISGPPPRALAAFKTSGSLETKVVVSREVEA